MADNRNAEKLKGYCSDAAIETLEPLIATEELIGPNGPNDGIDPYDDLLSAYEDSYEHLCFVDVNDPDIGGFEPEEVDAVLRPIWEATLRKLLELQAGEA